MHFKHLIVTPKSRKLNNSNKHSGLREIIKAQIVLPARTLLRRLFRVTDADPSRVEEQQVYPADTLVLCMCMTAWMPISAQVVMCDRDGRGVPDCYSTIYTLRCCGSILC